MSKTKIYNVQEHIHELKQAELKPLIDLIKRHEAEARQWKEMFIRLTKEGSRMLIDKYGYAYAAESLLSLSIEILDEKEKELKNAKIEKALERETQKLDDLVKQAHAAMEMKNGN